MNGYRRGAELGVSQGRFTTYLCSIMPEMHILAVDLWAPLEHRPGVEGAETYGDWPHERNYRNFAQHVDRHFPGRVTVARMDTAAAAGDVADASLDFIFIDADHSYAGALRDIKAWTPKVAPGGMVMGHDYNWPTVCRAVEETGFYHVLGPDNVWARYV